MGGDTATSTKKKKGLFSRFKKKDKKGKKDETLEPTPPPSPQSQEQSKSKTKKSVTKDGIPVVTADNPDDFTASDVQQTNPGEPKVSRASKKAAKNVTKSQKKSKRGPRPGSVVLEKPPTAREAAFGGPPRYDWIDVEVSLAVLRFHFDRHGQVSSFGIHLFVSVYIDKFESFLLNKNVSMLLIGENFGDIDLFISVVLDSLVNLAAHNFRSLCFQ